MTIDQTMDGTGAEVQDGNRLSREVGRAARHFTRTLQIRLAQYGVSIGQWSFLRALWMEDGLSQRELSKRVGLTEPTTHSALQKLEDRGLITRRTMTGNNRRLHSFLTEEGKALKPVLEPLTLEVDEVAVRGLDAAQQVALKEALEAVIENLEADEAAAAERGLRVPPTRERE